MKHYQIKENKSLYMNKIVSVNKHKVKNNLKHLNKRLMKNFKNH